MSLAQRFGEFVRQKDLFHEKDTLLLAVSGGVDSVVLCDLCHKAGFDFIIAHCNFQLRGLHSDNDEQFVKTLASTYNVPFYSRSFATSGIAAATRKSIEETARDLRYEWFNELLDPHNSPVSPPKLPRFILTAHHADDNIETVMMKFFRGTGIKGLRGILPKQGKIIRPMLFARRKEIEDYATMHQLKFVTDHTNFESTFTRNFFRNRIIPLVQQFFPEAEKNILNNTNRFVEIELLYNEAVALHKKKLMEVKGSEIHIPVLKLKKSVPLQTIAYEIMKDFGFTAHQIPALIALLDSESGKYMSSSTHRIIRNRNWLIIAPLETKAADTLIVEEGTTELVAAIGRFRFRIDTVPGADMRLAGSPVIAMLDKKEIQFPLLLRRWKAGDYFYPLGMRKKKKLARFFIDQKLSRTQKENVWVIESNKKIAWVVGHRIDDRFKITSATKEIIRISLDT